MKIRADFVTNSSSSSYIDLYIENEALKNLLRKYSVSLKCLNNYFEADACGYNEELNIPSSFEDLLDYVVSSTNNLAFKKAVEVEKKKIMSDFLFVKWNEGFSYTDGDINGRDVHLTANTRWGIIQEQTALLPDLFEGDIEDCWEESVRKIVARPLKAYNQFDGERPEDYRKRTDNDESQQLLLDHIDDAPVDIRNKSIALCGFGCDYTVYDFVASEEDFEDMEAPFGDRPALNLDGNMSEEEMIQAWLEIFGCRSESVYGEEVSPDTDYLVICMRDIMDFDLEFNLETIESAIDQGIRIISDYQLWNAIFIDGKHVLDEYEARAKLE